MQRKRLFALLLLACGCGDHSTDPQVRAAPVVAIRTAADGDSDGDGRIDLEITWRDTIAIDRARTVVKEIGADSRGNLLTAWKVTSTDTSITVVETIDKLLPPGRHQFEVQVYATSGSRAIDTVRVDLPAAKLIRTLAPDRDTHGMRAYEIALCGGLGYMPAGPNMLVFDPDSLRIVADIRNPSTLLELKRPACAGTGEVFVTEPLYSFDTRHMGWSGEVPGTYAADAIAQSRVSPNMLYLGERDGAIAKFDAATHERIGRISDQSTVPRDYTFAIAVLPGDKKLYFTRVYEGGIVVLNPQNGQTLSHIQLGTNSNGSGDDLALSPDGKWLYAPIYDGDPHGVEIISTDDDAPKKIIVLSDCRPTGVGVSPSGRRLFVTTQDLNGVESQNLLIDLNTNAVIERFPRPRDGRRIDYKVLFHPNGKYIFVVRNMTIDVYFNRE